MLVIYATSFARVTCVLSRVFHGTFGENNRQVIARDPTLTHSLYSVPLPSLSLTPSTPCSFQPSDTRPETPRLVFSPQFFRHICFCLATTMHRLHRYDIKICAAMYLLLSFFLRLPSLYFCAVFPRPIAHLPISRLPTRHREDFAFHRSRRTKNYILIENSTLLEQF